MELIKYSTPATKTMTDLPAEIIAKIAEYLIEQTNALASLRAIRSLAMSCKRFNNSLQSSYFPLKMLIDKGFKEKRNGLTWLGPWTNGN